MRGVTLDEIAAATKIGTRSLKALEDENFAILPGGIFNKGFVRAYARFLGMNEDQAVTDYQAAAKDQPVSVKTIAAQSAIAKANKLAAQQARESRNSAGVLRAIGLLVLAIALAAGGFFAFRHGYFKAMKLPSLHRQMKMQAQAEKSQPPVVTPEGPAATSTPPPTPPSPATSAPQPEVTPAATPAATESVTQAAAEAGEFTVSIKASEASWLSVMADGKRAFQRTMNPNEEQSVTAKTKVRIVIGNPVGTELSLNGHPLTLTGSLTHPRTVVVDANGITSE
jgi:cytoskeleton protein RodZ